jgi:hypothetical protein
MKPTAAQIRQWSSFKQVAKRTNLEVRATSLEVQNLSLLVGFTKSKNVPFAVDLPAIVAEFKQINTRNERLKEAILQVELGAFGLRFTKNDIDILAPPGTSDDIVTKHQLGWLVYAIGITIGIGVIAYMAALRHQNAELNAKVSSLVDEGDSLLCADPNSAQCQEWTETKQKERFDARENLIDSITGQAQGLPDAVVKIGGALTGVLIPIAVIVGAWAWAKSK